MPPKMLNMVVCLVIVLDLASCSGSAKRWKDLDALLRSQASANVWAGIVHATQGIVMTLNGDAYSRAI